MNSFPSGEYELISRLQALLGSSRHNGRYELGIGDDAAVRRCSSDEQIILTADVSVQDVHFSLDYMSLAEVGYRAMVSNVSDCAAMGALADSALVQLVFPADHTDVSAEIELVYKGFAEACERFGFPIVGGDLSRGHSWVIAITLIGRTEASRRVLTRTGIHPGDHLWVTGVPGRSAAGLAALKRWGRPNLPEQYRSLATAHIRPEPRLEIGYALAGCDAVCAMMDLSDGISKDCRTLCYENGLGLLLSIDSSQIPHEMVQLSSSVGGTWQDFFVQGGEEYELLFAASPSFDPAALFSPDVSSAFLRIGLFTEGPGKFAIRYDGAPEVEVPKQSWDHLRRALL